jgi:hypothetical protein
VARLANGTPDSFKEFRNTNAVIISGMVSRWPALSAWTPEGFGRMLLQRGNPDIVVLTAKDNVHFLKHELCHVSDVPFDVAAAAVFAAKTAADTRSYCRAPLFDEFVDDIDLSTLGDLVNETAASPTERAFASEVFKQKCCSVWFGTAGNVTPLHYDRGHGFLTQVVGRKRVYIFRPEDTMFLYPTRDFASKNQTTSTVNLTAWLAHDESERALHPKVAEAAPYVVDLHPGEALYIPPFHWHYVVSVDDCVSVLLPFDQEAQEDKPAAMAQ